MRNSIGNGAGLERLGLAIVIVILCVLAALAVVSVGAHALYALWKGLA